MRFFHRLDDLRTHLVFHGPGDLFPHPGLHGLCHLFANVLFIRRLDLRASGGLQLVVDHVPDLVRGHLRLHRFFDPGLHRIRCQLLFDLRLDRRLVGMAHGVLHLFTDRGCHSPCHLFKHRGLDLFAHLGLRALLDLPGHDLADAVDDLLPHLCLDGGFDLFAHPGLRALLDLLGHDLANALFHLGLDLLPRRIIYAVHHQLVGGFLYLAHDLFPYGCAHLFGQLTVGLGIDVIHDLVQQLPLQAHHFLSVVVDGQGLQFDIQLVKIPLLFLKGVVGGVEERLEHVLRGIHERFAVAVDLIQARRQGGSTAGELLDAVFKFACAVVERVGAFPQRAHAVVQRLCAVVQIGSAFVQLLRAVCQTGSAVVQLLSAVQQRLGTVRQLVRAVPKLACAIRQLPGAAPQFAGAVCQPARAVPKLRGAVRQRVRAAVQPVHGVLKILAQRIGIQVDLVLIPNHIGHIAGGEGIGAVRGVVHHVRLDGAGCGHLELNFIVFGKVQRLCEARQAIADHAPQAARGHILAVGHPDVGEAILLHPDDGDHDEGHRHRLAPAVDDHLVLPQRLIADVDLQMAAPARKRLGVDGPAVQPVCEMHRDGQRRVGRALVDDLVAVGLPRDHIVCHVGKGLVAANVLYVFKAADVDDLIPALVVVQPRADGDAVHIALGVCEGVDGLLLILRQGGQHARTEHGQHDDPGKAAHAITFHMMKPPFLRQV